MAVKSHPVLTVKVETPNVLRKQGLPAKVDRCQHINKDDERDSFSLRWLFDEDNPEHISIEDKVLQYKHRDLRQVKLYKCATKIFWTPPSRKRVIIAPPSGYSNRNDTADTCNQSEPIGNETIIKSTSVILAPDRVSSDPSEYKTWIAERKALRSGLDQLGVNEAYLKRKPNKTPLERSVLAKMIEARTPKPKLSVILEDPPYDLRLTDDIPKFRRPCPQAILVIEDYLTRKRLRLIDLFKNVDKRKKWKVNRDEFANAVLKAGIPLSELALEDLIVSLDVYMDNCIDYRELTKGINDLRRQKKADKQKQLNEEKEQDQNNGDVDRTSSRQSVSSESSSRLSLMTPPLDPERLTPPEVDIKPERYQLGTDESMVALRKRSREMAKARRPKTPTKLPKTDFFDGRSMIKIGDPAIDNHCRPCTIEGEVGRLVDKFRLARLREYEQILELCKLRNIPLTQKVLAKALLYPPEKPPGLLRRKLRQTGDILVSLDQHHDQTAKRYPNAENQSSAFRSLNNASLNKAETSWSRRHTAAGGRSDSVDDDSDHISRVRFRPRKNKPKKVVLSTGKAYIGRKVDCWMTFDEYEKFMSKMEDKMYENGKCNEHSFWPGYLLDKLRLMPLDDSSEIRTQGSSPLFQKVERSAKRAYPGHDNDLNLWPISRAGYLMLGHYDPYKNKY